MTAPDVLERVATSMVAVGLYKDVETALRALALEQIERKIAAYQAQLQTFENKYGRSLEEQSRLLEGKATMEEEEEWMEWKGTAVMLEAWQKALQGVLRNPNIR